MTSKAELLMDRIPMPVQAAANTATTVAVAAADIDWIKVGWGVLLALQIIWWSWKLIEKWQSKRG